MTWVMWNVVLVYFEIVLVSTQDRCTIFSKCTIGLEILLGAPSGTVTRLKWKLDLVRLEIVLILSQDKCIVYAKCTIGSEIIQHAPNNTPR
jgi:hypothetical protein